MDFYERYTKNLAHIPDSFYLEIISKIKYKEELLLAMIRYGKFRSKGLRKILDFVFAFVWVEFHMRWIFHVILFIAIELLPTLSPFAPTAYF